MLMDLRRDERVHGNAIHVGHIEIVETRISNLLFHINLRRVES